MPAPLPLIAIVGRPNVGKSTLFNRVIGARKSVVSSIRATTRDRIVAVGQWRGVRFRLMDMGGMEFGIRQGLDFHIQRHVEQGLQEADVFILMCDGQAGLLPTDQMVRDRLRATGKPVIAVVNKLDDRLSVPPDFYTLGVPELVALSALHGKGTGDLLDQAIAHLKDKAGSGLSLRSSLSIAIVGRQNVGKSSLFNALLDEERAIVSEIPGTTRDAVDTFATFQNVPVTLIDTAGLRHRRKVKNPIDTFSMTRTLEALARSQVALFVLDAGVGVVTDDLRIASAIAEAGCGVVILLNKWDLVKEPNEKQLPAAVGRFLPMLSFAPVLAVSAKTGYNVPEVIHAAYDIHQRMLTPMSDADCLALLRRAWISPVAPRMRGRLIRLHAARWITGRPVRLEVTASPGGELPLPFLRTVIKNLHRKPQCAGLPLRLITTTPSKQRHVPADLGTD